MTELHAPTLLAALAGDVQTTPRPAQRRVARKYWGCPMAKLKWPPNGRNGDRAFSDQLDLRIVA